MSSFFVLLKPYKEIRTLVTFSFGSRQKVYATTWNSPIYWKGNAFKPEPAIGIKLPKQSGGIEEEACSIRLPLTRAAVHPELGSLARTLASVRAAPRTRVEIVELVRDGSDERVNYLYEGILEKSRTNPNGVTGVVELEFASELTHGLERISLGVRCDPQCKDIFGGVGCGHPAYAARLMFDAATYFPNHLPVTRERVRSGWVLVTVDSDNPRKVYVALDSVKHPTPSPAPVDAAWRAKTISEQGEDYWIGSFLKDEDGTGLKVSIQAWDRGTNSFMLAQIPPKDWDNKTLLLQVDCPKTQKACAQRKNEDRFGGIGYGIPAFNPALEVS